MPRHVEGRKVESVEAVEQPGDYFVKRVAAGIEALWFAMPGFAQPVWNRIPGPAASDGTRWEITEDAEGRVTVSPSILSWWTEAGAKRRFHAFLKEGIWEVLDDTVGSDLT